MADIRKAEEQFTEFAGNDVPMEIVDKRMAAEFVLDFLPEQTSPKASEGIGPATIGKRCTALNNVWDWASRRGFIDDVVPGVSVKIMSYSSPRRIIGNDPFEIRSSENPVLSSLTKGLG